jgi:alpha-L-rhamnosidase
MVEDAFLENFCLFKNEGQFPMGALPMCYPEDEQDDKKFIPQWTMWYFLEVEEYLNKRGHNTPEERERFRPSLEALLKFYAIYENGDGLLERLPSWNFVEWSRANEWGTDVNYPTNFLYAAVLEAAYRIFGDEFYLRRAGEVREKAIAASFDGTRFYDHSVRNRGGNIKLCPDCSEIAQYYAILFGGFDINDEKYAALKHLVTKVCYADSTEMPEDMEPINAFIGVYLRLEALLHIKEYDLVLSDVRAFFGEMEKLTGTLWEYRQRNGSRDHGFASYALVAILRALEKN